MMSRPSRFIAAMMTLSSFIPTVPAGASTRPSHGTSVQTVPAPQAARMLRGSESVLYAFKGSPDGSMPLDALIADSVGAFYGTTNVGGAAGDGTAFKMTPTSSGGYTESVLYSFQGGADGRLPIGGLAVDSSAALYGTTTEGGGGGNGFDGVVFKLTPAASGGYTESVLYAFQGGVDGRLPWAPPIVEASGVLYGTTVQGGTGSAGTVYALTPQPSGGYTESVLYAFQNGNDGFEPEAGLIADATGALYGTTAYGGSGNGNGTVFKLTPTSSGAFKESVLYAFQGGSDGAVPLSGLMEDASGALYGTTEYGGSGSVACPGAFPGCGIVFKLTPKGKHYKESVLHTFQGGADGAHPLSTLIGDASGVLYGTTEGNGNGSCTQSGSSNGCGTVFEVTPKGKRYKVLYSFKGGADGASPLAGLIEESGVLYGTTSLGGIGSGYGNGIIFALKSR